MASGEDVDRLNEEPGLGDVPPIAPAPDARLDLVRLIDEHHAALYRYAFRLTGQQADAEDLLQQVFLVAQQKLHQVRSAGSARAWLYAVLRSRFWKSQRRRRPEKASDWELDLDQIAVEVDAAPAWLAEIEEGALQRALDELPESFRIVVLMFYFEDLSYREIADQLDLPIGTVMSRLARARQQLRTSLVAAAEPARGSSARADAEEKKPRRVLARR